MKKRLRFAMPHVPLYKHKREDTDQIATTSYGTSRVGTMAKLISSANKKRHKHKPLPEGAGVDDSETSDDYDDDECLTESSPLVQC